MQNGFRQKMNLTTVNPLPKAQNEKVDVMFKAEDVAKLNRIYEQLGYAIPKVTTADRKKDPTRRQSGDSLLTRGKNPLDIDPRPSVRATMAYINKRGDG